MPLVPLAVQPAVFEPRAKVIVLEPAANSASKIPVAPMEPAFSWQFWSMVYRCALAGVIAAGSPVTVKVVALLVPVLTGNHKQARPPILYHVAATVVAAENPVSVRVTAPPSGDMSIRPAAVAARPCRAPEPRTLKKSALPA